MMTMLQNAFFNSASSIGQSKFQGNIVDILMSSTRGIPTSIAPIDQIPSGSLHSPDGTILHGNLSADNEKRLKLQIFYTNFNQ